MSSPVKRIESIRELTHELVHVEKLIVRLRELPRATVGNELLELATDLHRDGARRLNNLRQQAAR